MKKTGILSMILSLGATAGSLFSCRSDEAKPAQPEPTVRAALADGKLHVHLSIPSRHHAYLDAGREGNLIPVTFDWKGWGENPAESPKAIQSPAGDVDADSGARVLRGEGTYVFQPKTNPSLQEFRVRVQICDEVKGVCYRPAWYSLKPGA